MPENRWVVIYLGPLDAVCYAEQALSWPLVTPNPTRNDVKDCIKGAVAILDASMKVRFDRSLLDLAPGLKVISTATTGADHIDAKALAERNIPLYTLAGEKELLRGLTPAAELSWTLLMSCARRLRGAVDHVLKGNWNREGFPGMMLREKTLGVIGCGRIGQWMARYGHAFDMKVIGYDPFLEPWPDSIVKKSLDDVLSTADFVSLHVLYSEQVTGLIGAREFGIMKQGAVFINTSRGALTDEAALLAALKEKRLGAAGLDVLTGEPEIQSHPLIQYAREHDNLIITPHVGGFSPEAVGIVVAHAAKRIQRTLQTVDANPYGA